MEARFIGDPLDNFEGPRVITMYGASFVKDEWAPIDDMPAEHIAKLQWNSHFEVREGSGKGQKRPAAAEKPPAEAEPTSDDKPSGASAFDPDGDGKVGGSTA